MLHANGALSAAGAAVAAGAAGSGTEPQADAGPHGTCSTYSGANEPEMLHILSLRSREPKWERSQPSSQAAKLMAEAIKAG